MKKGIVLLFMIFFQLYANSFGQTVQTKKITDNNNKVSFLMEPAVNVSKSNQDNWLGNLITAAIEFRCGCVPELNVTTLRQVSMVIPGYKDISGPVSEHEYTVAARKLGVSHIGKAKYELGSDGNIFYYLEITSVDQINIAATVEKNFRLEKIDSQINEIVIEILKALNITPTTAYTKASAIPILNSNSGDLKLLGDGLASSQTLNSNKNDLASSFKNIYEKDNQMILANVQSGYMYEGAGKYSEATDAFNQVLKIFPDYTLAFGSLVKCYRYQNRINDALGIIANSEKMEKKSIDLIIENAVLLYVTGKKKEAETEFGKVLEIDSDNSDALLFCARVSNDEGKADNAISFCNRYLKANRESAEILIELGRGLMTLKKYDAAITAFIKASQINSNDAISLSFLGDIYVIMNNSDKAAQFYDRALLLSKENMNLYLKTARAFRAAGNEQRALEILKSVENKFSNNAEFIREIGLLKLINKDTVGARTDLENNSVLSAADDQVLLALGLIYLNSKEYDKSLVMLSKALPLLKDKIQCKIGLVKNYLQRADYPAAIQLLDDLWGQKASITGAYVIVGDYFMSEGEKSKALQCYKREAQQSKQNVGLLLKIAQISLDIGSFQDCKAACMELLRTGNATTDVYYMLALVSLNAKEIVDATEYVSKAAKMGAADANTYLRLGEGFRELGSLRDAAIAFQKCIGIDPSNENALLGLIGASEKLQKDSIAAENHLKLFALNNEKYKNNLIRAGQLFEKAKLAAKARSSYQLFLDKKYDNPEVNIQLAKMEYQDKKYESVISLMQNVSPTSLDSQSLIIAAESYFAMQQYQKTIQYTSLIQQKYPSIKHAIEMEAISYEKSGSVNLAIPLYQKFLPYAGVNIKYAIHLGELIEKTRSANEAIAYYENISQQYSHEDLLFDHLSRLYFAIKDWNKAIASGQKALNSKNANSDLNLILARSYLNIRNTEGMDEGYKRYLTSNRSDDSVWFEYGVILFKSNKYKSAIGCFTNAIDSMSNSYELQWSLGVAYYKLGDYSNATKPLEKAFELKGEADIDLYEMLRTCYRTQKSRSSLITLLKNWCSIDKNNFGILTELGGLYTEDTNWIDASKILENALTIKPCSIEVHLQLAEIYQKLNQPDQWGGHLRSALGCDPKNADLLFKVSEYFEFLKDSVRSSEYLQQTLSIQADHAEANFKLGKMLLNKNNIDGAIEHFIIAAKFNPTTKNILALANAYYSANKKDNAYKTIHLLNVMESDDVEVLKLAGRLYMEYDYLDSSMNCFEKTLKLDSHCAECYAELANIDLKKQSFNDAAKNYETALELSGYNEKWLIKLAQVYGNGKNVELERKCYQKVLAHSPASGEAIYKLSHSYIVAGNFDIQNAILGPIATGKSGWWYLTRGEYSESQGNIADAYGNFLKALELLPDVPEVLAGCGRSCLKQNKYNEAIEYFAKAMIGDPENYQYMLDMGKAYEGIKEYSAALDLYNDVRREQPNNIEVKELIGNILNNRDDHILAVKAIKGKIEKNRKNGQLYLELGNEYRMLSMFDEAVEAYLRAIKLDEKTNFDAYRCLGNIFLERGDQKKAKKYYESYIMMGGQDNSVRIQLKGLK